ncbi:hypothetical protein ONA91_16815 [Micromonospora sp. DR5-3]|uniref:hypothetical protein n=1 Tax=unclassified Micromonospora TaxID=2617518 RepID=UPI0011D86247|nr:MULTISPECIES: hypothetical protein [unclassified Micromonospora]MCW3816106.1 hypothetical protein [Micromonospora sp. DR5-3]TYC22164.1 hypothetical protein FXF52_22125 [Micromonospora sp. MP36]
MKIRTAAVVVAAIAATAALTACGDDDAAPRGVEVAVTATDTSCEITATSFAPGATTFLVTNRGSQTTEVYVYGRQGDGFTKAVGEVKDVSSGLTRELRANLSVGFYELACKPGQKGDGIRTRITVTDDATWVNAGVEPTYDREVRIEVTTKAVTGADGLFAEPGAKLQFKVENKTPVARTLEILDPSGKQVAGVTADPNGGAAETIVSLADAGDWTLKIGGPGVEPVTKRLSVR